MTLFDTMAFFFWSITTVVLGLPCGSLIKNPAMQETWVRSLGQEGPLEKKMAAHSSILAREIPWTQEPGGLQFIGVKKSRI